MRFSWKNFRRKYLTTKSICERFASYYSNSVKEMTKGFKVGIIGMITIAALFMSFWSLSEAHDPILISITEGSIFRITPIDNELTGGTAFQIDTPKGPRLITNAHVCASLTNGVGLIHHDSFKGAQAVAKVIKLSEHADLCMLTGILDIDSLQIAEDAPQSYQKVMVVGYPYGGPLHASTGRITASLEIQLGLFPIASDEDVGRCLERRGTLMESFFGPVCVVNYPAASSTTEIYPGNSGSPVLDWRGRVVGVAFASHRVSNRGYFVRYKDLVEFLQ